MGVAIAKPREPPTIHVNNNLDKNELSGASSNAIQIVPSTTKVSVAIRDLRMQVAISSRIDQTLQNEKIEDLTRVKILLLGGADAGKSTILKQMRILHMNGFDADEMHSFQKYLRYNLFQIFHEVAIGVEECVTDIANIEKNKIYRFSEGISWIIGIDEEQEIEFLLDFIKLDCVRSFIELYPNYSTLPDNASYYIPKLPALLSANYKPTAEDILHLRIPTTSVNEINFAFSNRTIRLIDVGGQRTYRKKWIHYFDGVAAVLFVVSMAAYDQSLDEVDKMLKPVLHKDIFPVEAVKPKPDNRLRDSAQLFGDMLRSKYLATAAFILFLNKKDLFWKKLPIHPLGKYVNAYKGTNNDEAAEFLKEYFLKRKSKNDKDRPIYSHFTCATDTENVEFVFKAACEIVLQKNLNKSGIQ
ncbi:hypothetical protein PRIPAC_81319 [Pristionchus pacificus]|uniref:ADP ribosylation factor n=1 Tax=Pristionchus pacificus TaxID=54126 RepID=A0A2A6CJW3_PRIPA|nr:hypothetical protein PRIPAC_81319 [Pristionchus pacificus]|eukprot:PDM78311.1 ADP ribosylation factor [Pristionchus pacificus]